jgi:predicted RNA-binding Zn-ribbon protein involved in translation (DUF1610 family)
MPEPVPPKEAEIYRRFVEMHCDQRGTKDHECKGKITITAKSLTLQCPLCGDARKTIPDGAPPDITAPGPGDRRRDNHVCPNAEIR